MKLKLYYVVQLEQNKLTDHSLQYEAGPFKSWQKGWDYVADYDVGQGQKDLYVVENELEVQL